MTTATAIYTAYGTSIRAALTAANRAEFTDPATVALVEDWMRTETGGTLDHLSAGEFAEMAVDNLEIMLTAPQVAKLTAEALRWPVPAWAA